jgi:hypothetical protein
VEVASALPTGLPQQPLAQRPRELLQRLGLDHVPQRSRTGPIRPGLS